MSTENDDFMDDLLKGLPRAEPISEFEIRKFEKLIDQQAAQFKKSKRSLGFKIPASIATSLAVAFGTAFLLSNHSQVINAGGGVIQSPAPQTSESATQNGGTASTPAKTVSPKKSKNHSPSQTTSDSTQVFANSNSSNAQDGSVAKFETNLDYSIDLSKIKKVVVLSVKPSSMSLLDNTAQQCAIRQGISESLLAFDKGYFQGQRVSAYYTGLSRNEYKIILVDSDCALVTEL